MSISPEIFWKRLEQEAQRIGFTDIAVAKIEKLKEEKKFLEKWLKKGYAADMHYMAETKKVREDPKRFLPRAASVLVCTVNYYHAQKVPEKAGRIARYAYGRDYHKTMKAMLLKLQHFLQTQLFQGSTSKDFRLSLDAHPVLERAWAKRAGLGFLGKNSCLITEKAGSWVLLGCIVTTQKMPLKSKTAKVDFAKLSCGNCTKCLAKCPTGAIVAPGVVDANKCISYLTIENKGAIPLELRESVGDHLFGCDICQVVCPFNQRREKEDNNPLHEKPIAGSALLVSEILALENDRQFLARFAGSPLMRAKRTGLLRNACVVAGNLGHTEFIPLLQAVIQRETSPLLQEHARWAVKKIVGARCGVPLLR